MSFHVDYYTILESHVKTSQACLIILYIILADLLVCMHYYAVKHVLSW